MPTGVSDSAYKAIFGDMTDDQAVTFLQHAEVLDVDTGQMVIKEGEQADSFFIVWSGSLAVFITGQDATVGPTAVNHLSEGTVFGEMTYLRGGKYCATVRAVTTSKLLRISHIELRGLIARDPALGAILLRKIYRLLSDKLADIVAEVDEPAVLEQLAKASAQQLAIATEAVRTATVERERRLQIVTEAIGTRTFSLGRLIR